MYSKWAWNICTIVFHSKALLNLPKIGIFGLKVYHLATLVVIRQNWKGVGVRPT
jgi:hypothetical protein